MIYSIDVILSSIMLAVVLGTTVLSIPVIKETYAAKYVEAHKVLSETRFVYYYTGMSPWKVRVNSGSTETLPYTTTNFVNISVGLGKDIVEEVPLNPKMHKAFTPPKNGYKCPCFSCSSSSNAATYYILKNSKTMYYYKYGSSYVIYVRGYNITGHV